MKYTFLIGTTPILLVEADSVSQAAAKTIENIVRRVDTPLQVLIDSSARLENECGKIVARLKRTKKDTFKWDFDIHK